MILAGDIGGTKASLALFDRGKNGTLGPRLMPEVFRAAEFDSPEALFAEYRRRHPERITCAAFGVAGPPVRGHVTGTNLAWPMDASSLERTLEAPVFLLNDLEASGYGVPALGPADLASIHAGMADPEGNAALIAPGTGLGESTLARVAGDLVPVASEGGHADFAPRTDDEIDLFRELRAKHGRVSYETVLSGPGLARIAEWTHDSKRAGSEGAAAWSSHLTGPEGKGGLPARVSHAALQGTCGFCARALEMFVSVLGAEAGNLALRCVARAGIYLAGGIAPKILPAVDSDAFRAAFTDKEPHRELLSGIPVWIVRNEHSAVLGAARYASLRDGRSV